MTKRAKKIVLIISLILLFFIDFSLVFAAQLDNPLGEEDPRIIIGNIIRAGLGIVGSLTLAFFIIGGFFWITSAGNDEKVKRGKDIIIWASFGLALIFFSYALVTFLLGALAGSGSGGGGQNIGQTPGVPSTR